MHRYLLVAPTGAFSTDRAKAQELDESIHGVFPRRHLYRHCIWIPGKWAKVRAACTGFEQEAAVHLVLVSAWHYQEPNLSTRLLCRPYFSLLQHTRTCGGRASRTRRFHAERCPYVGTRCARGAGSPSCSSERIRKPGCRAGEGSSYPSQRGTPRPQQEHRSPTMHK